MSSTDPVRAKVEDQQPETKNEKQAWHEFHKDFDSFKRAVDKAIERDAYGTLFGRRLRSPDTANNSSWTSWSWIFDPKEIKESPVPEPSKPVEEPRDPDPDPSSAPQAPPIETDSDGTTRLKPSVSHSSSSSRTSTTLKSSHSIIFHDHTSLAAGYVYDPISGRKVPQKPASPVDTTSPTISQDAPEAPQKAQPEKGDVESLSTEQGTEIPAKVCKPSKVYGYTGEIKSNARVDSSAAPSWANPKKSFESSKKREYDALRMRTYGNNIDATNFNCEPWNNKEPGAAPTDLQQPAEKRIRTFAAPDEEAPLFSGTTYESKLDGSIPSRELTTIDDFRAGQGLTLPSLKSDQPALTPKSEFTARMEPAVDRAASHGTGIPVKKFSSKLETSVDRISMGPRLEPATDRTIRIPPKTDFTGQDRNTALKMRLREETVEPQDQLEDIDLLRASDVRAGARPARVTKQAIEEKKEQDRKALEQHFEEHTKTHKADLDTVWKHIQQYPNGIVARTMQSVDSNADDKNAATSERVTNSKPKFSEATVRPDIVRNLSLENHTQVFEPKVADIHDQAKSITHELRALSRDVDKKANIQATAAAEETNKLSAISMKTSESPKPIDESSNKPATDGATSTERPYGGCSFVLLLCPPEGKDVQVLPMNELAAGYSASDPDFNAISTLGSLANPTAFIKHFIELDKNGYELIDGSRDTLIFRRREVPSVEQSISSGLFQSSTSDLHTTIAAAEAAAQPKEQSSSDRNAETLQAADVLDKIPTAIPMPGPAAPTAPSSSQHYPFATPVQYPTESEKREPQELPQTVSETTPASSDPQSNFTQSQDRASKPRKHRARMTRQEEVFSGQQRLKPQTTALPDPGHFQKQTPSANNNSQYKKENEYDTSPRQGFFERIRRAIKRTILTAFAFGAGAYGIGVITEGLQARAQIAQGESGGPMKRLVLDNDARRNVGERQRPGIFSTESSR